MRTKTFDAVQMKRHGAEKIHEQTKEMTEEEKLAFWQELTDALRKRQQNREKTA